jgi:hypothetical protein
VYQAMESAAPLHEAVWETVTFVLGVGECYAVPREQAPGTHSIGGRACLELNPGQPAPSPAYELSYPAHQ